MRIVVAGGTGFIGQALIKRLHQEGDEALIFSRKNWHQLKNSLPPCDAVINLCGANVMAKRWTPERKRELFSSRLDTTRDLVEAIVTSPNPPDVFINTSATAHYQGFGLLYKLCEQWERAAKLPPGHPTRQVIIRIGVALGKEGGAFPRMKFPVRLGSGEQSFPWIHIDDLVNLYVFAIKHPISGAFDGVAPDTVSQAEFAKALGRVVCPVPAFLLKLMLGERSRVLLEGVHVDPTYPEGFTCKFPKLKEALKNLW